MKITIESTTMLVELNGVPARIWEGETENGVKVHCFITRVAIDKNEKRLATFKKELQEQKAPSPEIAYYPTSLIL